MAHSSRTPGRSPCFGRGMVLAALAATGACDTGPPAATAVEGFEGWETWDSSGVARVHSPSPAEHLIVGSELPLSGELLFMDGRATNPVSGGRAWADPDGARVVVVDKALEIANVVGGAPEGEAPLSRAWFAVEAEGTLAAVQPDGRAVRFATAEGEGVVPWDPDLPVPPSANGGEVLAGTRTVMDLEMRPLGRDEPLLWMKERGGPPRGIGKADTSGDPLLGRLHNSGWVTFLTDGSIAFASSVRNEVRLYGSEGGLRWTATWGKAAPQRLRFSARDGTAQPEFEVVQYGVASGRDGRIYVLARATDDPAVGTVVALDGRGRWVRSARVPRGAAIVADRQGRVSVVEPEEILARTAGVSRVAFPQFRLPALTGAEELGLTDHRGKVVVLNFWASWCGPCRREMPLLGALSSRLDPAEAVVLGMNDDRVVEDALGFLEELGGLSYPSVAGRGELGPRFGVRGLPYTVVLDREGRVAATMYGFGSTIDPIEAAVRTELTAAEAAGESTEIGGSG